MTIQKMMVGSVLLMTSGLGIAASDGSLGATSTGTSDITATIPNLVRITDVDDIPLGTFDGSTDMVGESEFCVYDNVPEYQVTATGSGAGNAFTIASGANTIAYTVKIDDDLDASDGAAMTSGSPVQDLVSNETTQDCGGTGNPNASVEITVTSAVALAASSGSYTGTLTLVVAPE